MWGGLEDSLRDFWMLSSEDFKVGSDWKVVQRVMDKMQRFPNATSILKYAGPLSAVLSAEDAINAALNDDRMNITIGTIKIASELVKTFDEPLSTAWDANFAIDDLLSDLASLNRTTND